MITPVLTTSQVGAPRSSTAIIAKGIEQGDQGESHVVDRAVVQ
jgi:hypothetical protein